MKFLCLVSIAFQAFFSVSSGHSWVHCTNYKGEITGQDFDEDLCDGYIRLWDTRWQSGYFSQDLGVNYFGSDGAWCQTKDDSGTSLSSLYDDQYEMATYYVGDTIKIVWPAKNHANYECFSFIPDTSMKLFYNPTPNQGEDLSSLSDWKVIYDWQDGCTAGTDGCGFQNCPKFCQNTDGAPCFGDFKVTAKDFPQDGLYCIVLRVLFVLFNLYCHKNKHITNKKLKKIKK